MEPTTSAPPPDTYPLGAHPLPDGRCSFRIWAPRADSLAVELPPRSGGGAPRLIRLAREGEVHGAVVDDVRDGDRYFVVLPDGRRRPDPRSRRQPEGVHGPSAVVDFAALGRRAGRPRLPPLREWVIQELHVGTYTPEGTFDALVARLPYLKRELGVDAVELMPVASFPGARNWGYDGAHLFSVQESYGGPAGLARLVDAAHAEGLAVILDVVYNHLGPEGNYLRELAPYFTSRHRTPWGEAVNFDDDGSAYVRAYVVENALQWVRDYRLDGLRVDAVHAVFDDSPRHVLAEVGAAVQAVGGIVVAESDLNDPVTVVGRPDGWGHDAQWSDDLHHALHALLTGERGGYYADFGAAEDLARALARGFVYDGTRPSAFRGGMRHGKSPLGVPAERHVVCLQNHDQVGNRASGDRLSHLAGIEAAKVGAAVVLLSPGIPLLFMGEEWAASRPFPYFTSHGDAALAKAVTEGRRREFAAFAWQGEVPDPQAEETFASAILDASEREREPHASVLAWYRRLIALRHEHPALRGANRQTRTDARAEEAARALWLERRAPDGRRLLALFAFGAEPADAPLRAPPGRWELLLDSGAAAFGGAGSRAPRTLEGELQGPLPPRVAWIWSG